MKSYNSSLAIVVVGLAGSVLRGCVAWHSLISHRRLDWGCQSTHTLAHSHTLRHSAISYCWPTLLPVCFQRPRHLVVAQAMQQEQQQKQLDQAHDNRQDDGWNIFDSLAVPPTTSLAGPFRIRARIENDEFSDDVRFTWKLVMLDTIQGIDEAFAGSEGARAFAALQMDPTDTTTGVEVDSGDGVFKLQTMIDRVQRHIRVSVVSSNPSENSNNIVATNCGELIPVLSRVMAQWSVLTIVKKHDLSRSEWQVYLDSESSPIVVDLTTTEGIWELFGNIIVPQASGSEVVEMVDRNGALLGQVPRKLVRVHNLLHRGVGLFVSADRPMTVPHLLSSDSNPLEQFPDLYVHRRSDTKRIFPSLYDMFVGGVSTAGEAPQTTAMREVAEELGLQCRHDTAENWCSEPLLRTTICTAYNRCVVDLFCYVMNTRTEHVSWQPEEVAWGTLVPYSTIVAAADRSIMRFANQKTWPGRLPPIQGSTVHLLLGQQHSDMSKSRIANQYEDVGSGVPWTEWDFVPDGLLVWEAWLQKLQALQTAVAE